MLPCVEEILRACTSADEALRAVREFDRAWSAANEVAVRLIGESLNDLIVDIFAAGLVKWKPNVLAVRQCASVAMLAQEWPHLSSIAQRLIGAIVANDLGGAIDSALQPQSSKPETPAERK